MNLLEDPPDLNHPLNSSNDLLLESIRHFKHTNRDQYRDVQLLHREGFSYAQIVVKQSLIKRQVRYAIQHSSTSQKHTDRPDKITAEELEHLI